MSEILKKAFSAHMKSFDEKERTVKWAISTGDLDRDNDRILPAGCKYENYSKNPVVLVDHDWTTGAIVAKNLSIEIAGNEIIAVTQFPPLGELKKSDEVFSKIKNGLISAVSIGFQPVDSEENAEGGFDVKTWELLEYSFVAIPSNPAALPKSKIKKEGDKGVKEMSEKTKDFNEQDFIERLEALEEKVASLESKIETLETDKNTEVELQKAADELEIELNEDKGEDNE